MEPNTNSEALNTQNNQSNNSTNNSNTDANNNIPSESNIPNQHSSIHECPGHIRLTEIAKECDSLSLYVCVLQALEIDGTFNEGRKFVLIEFTYMVIKNKPEISKEIIYILKLFLKKHYPSKPESRFPFQCRII